VLPKPATVSLLDAAGLPEVACTVWSNVGQLAHLSKGETILVHGGASGIGTHAIQVAKALGATVLCTAGTPEKLARCRELGADVAINYRTEDFAARVRDETGGVDVILDSIGAKYLARNIASLAPNGRLVIIGLQGGGKAEIDLGALLQKRAQLIATVLRARPVPEKAAIVAAVRERVWPLVESGAVRPVVDRVLPMSEAAEAHRVVEAGEHVGKVLLSTPSEG
jgi:putative PIG3 family NAD(P)H quinone oxidoreductase